MFDIIMVAAVVALIAVPAWMYTRRKAEPAPVRARAASQSVSRPASRHTPFRAVSVRSSGNGCDAVRALRGQRFLGHEAPNIPLADCDAPRCGCRYEHHSDRRFRPDRRFPYSSLGRNEHGEERRIQGERRSE